MKQMLLLKTLTKQDIIAEAKSSDGSEGVTL